MSTEPKNPIEKRLDGVLLFGTIVRDYGLVMVMTAVVVILRLVGDQGLCGENH